jgi:hypothetical protein
MRLAIFLTLTALVAYSQRNAGDIRLQVVDASGSPVEADVRLTGHATDVNRTFVTNADGRYIARVLPFGPYRLEVSRAGFASETISVDIRSEHPLDLRVTLGVAQIETALVVRDSDTLVDPSSTGAIQHIGRESIADRRSSTPGRSVVDLLNTQPGWLLEANGVLHPRGSEYQVQYVIDGIPMADNRSPAYAQSLGVEEFESMDVRTGNYPAEYGRKLGGVIEVSTDHDRRPGFHGTAVLQGGSFGTASGYASALFSTDRMTFGLSAEGMTTDRYLDPPVEQNFTNYGSGGSFSIRADRDWSDSDRTRVYLQRHRTGFLVPNESLQQSVGQRQDRTAEETMGHLSHQHVFSPRVLANVRLMARDTNASLWSNVLSTPIAPEQDRGFRETYLSGTVSATQGAHELKAGVDAIYGSIHETFGYRITAYRLDPGNVRIFDRDVPPTFAFADRSTDREQGAFIQDLWRVRNLTISAGVRFDHYRVVADATAWSPRLGIAYYVPAAKLVLRASYDRTFETPAVENILLASSNRLSAFGGEGAFLPLEPARGNFYEAGFSKAVGGHLRLDGCWYRRDIRNFPDDSLLLNSGVSFPIAFSKGEIYGYEAKVDVPRWGPFSGFVSYANMVGRGITPVSGGLFLGDEAGELLESAGSFPITQDQRNTVRARVRFQAHPRVWLAFGGRYNSGLPVEVEGPTNTDFVRAQYGQRILDRVNFSRGRTRPSSAVDASLGWDLWRQERRNLRLTFDALNLADNLNVVNFSGVFSGTAVEPPRSFAIRLRTEF